MIKCNGGCGETKPEEEFGWKNTAQGIRHNFCKECKRVYNKTWYEKNKSSHVANVAKNNARYKARFTERVNELKSVPCADCKKTFEPFLMDFDHLPDFEKKCHVSGMTNYSMISILEEVSKCEVVCCMCHRIRTRDRRLAGA